MSVDVSLVRRSRFTPIEAAVVAWWKKQGDALRAAMRERGPVKDRLHGQAEGAS